MYWDKYFHGQKCKIFKIRMRIGNEKNRETEKIVKKL